MAVLVCWCVSMGLGSYRVYVNLCVYTGLVRAGEHLLTHDQATKHCIVVGGSRPLRVAVRCQYG